VRNTKDLEQQLAQAGVKCSQTEDEKRALSRTVEELKAQLREYDHQSCDVFQSWPLILFHCCFFYRLEEEGVRRSGEGMGEIIVLKNEIESKNQQISTLTAEKAECLARQQQLENERLSLEAQRDDLKLHIEGSHFACLCASSKKKSTGLIRVLFFFPQM